MSLPCCIRACWLALLAAATLSAGPTAAAATIVIAHLEDVEFGNLPPTSGDVEQRLRVCVNADPAGPYQLTAQGAGSGGAFALTNGSGYALPFEIYIDRRGNRTGSALVPGVPLGGLSARSPNPSERCRPPFEFITIVVTGAALQQAPGGNYVGFLQLTVAPE